MTTTFTRQARARGALLGLAIGDALGTTIEFSAAGDPYQPRVSDLVGGGPFNLPAGGWTDDTSMALCLAESLIAKQDCDPIDQLERYVRWWQQGENSVTGACFDIGNATRAALQRYRAEGQAVSGSRNPNSAGNGSLMRLVPVVLASRDPATIDRWAEISSETTHAAPEAVDACRGYARLIHHALSGASKAEVLAPELSADLALAPAVRAVLAGSYRTKTPPAIRGTGYVVDALEAALWAFFQSEDFRSGALLAVNLGQDADTTGAIYGQLAGAFYGEAGLPAEWRARVLWAERIAGLADQLTAQAESML